MDATMLAALPTDTSTRVVMEGSGFYNANSRVQATGIASAFPLLEKAAADINPLTPGPIVMVDYGCSQGRNSMEPIGRAIRAMRRRAGVNTPINVVHVDRPANDFGALFETVESDPGSYFRNEPATFPSVIGRSFYDQVLPDEVVTLAWSSYAVNWLTQVPGGLCGHLWPDFVPAAVREALAGQLAEDWRRFVTLRARELRPGGRLVVVAPLRIPEVGTDLDPLMHVARSALMDLIAEGTLRRHEFGRMAIPGYGRTLEEYEAPFKDNNTTGLDLDECRAFEIEDPCWTEYLTTRDTEGLAEGYVGFFRAAFHPALLVHLDSDRNTDDRETISHRLSQVMIGRIASDPAPLINIRVAVLVMAKPEH